MRLTHLTELEIQAFLDLRAMHDKRGLSQEEALSFREKQEHLDTCIQCREQVQEYEFLFEELALPGVCNEKLSRNFARQTALRIPPFAAAYARATIRMWSAGGVAGLLLLLWGILSVNWTAVVGKAAITALPLFASVPNWLTGIAAKVPVPELPDLVRYVPSLNIDYNYLIAAASDMLTDPTVLAFAFLAGAVSLAFTSLDDIILADLINRRKH